MEEKKVNEASEKYREKRKIKMHEWNNNSKTLDIEEMMTFGHHVNKAWKNIYENNRVEK